MKDSMTEITMKKALSPEEKGLNSLVGTIGLEPTTPTMSRRCASGYNPMNTGFSGGLCQTTMSARESKRMQTYLREKREQLREEYRQGMDGVYGEDE